jgi:asparagine synthase (glutamine-hydrolysing)
MCGIAGAVGSRAAKVGLVSEQLKLLSHRGPDSHGSFDSPCAVIGQTRLRIIDLVTGDPPIATEDQQVGVSLNGEIYNYAELREELQQGGHTLKTQGDTEVIAHLAEACSPVELARRLDGMFAFAVWDRRKERLVLGRDRLGKKPLYYWCGEGQLVFGSEIKAVLAHPMVPREMDPAAIPSYLGFGYVPTPNTFFAGIKSLPPGHVLVYEPGGEPTIDRYWEMPLAGLEGSAAPTFTEAASRCRTLLERAVRKRLVSDVPLGAYLSGGVDSTAVVGLMAGAAPDRVRTFTIGFDDHDGFDERPFADIAAKRFGTDHTEFVVHPNALELLDELVWHHDQPFGDSSAIPTYALAQLTRKHVTVALCGDGGDELFAGYERFAAALAISRYRRVPLPLRRAGEGLLRAAPGRLAQGPVGKLRRFSERGDMPPHQALRSWVSYVSDDWRTRMVGDGASQGLLQYEQTWQASAGNPLLTRLLAINIDGYLLDDLLPKVDRMSMAHGLEVRSPFLDPELLEFAINLPARHQVRGLSIKRVLKHAVRDLLPDELLNRAKHGFGIPLDRWFRGDLRAYLEGMLGPEARLRAHIDGATVDAMVNEHMTAHANHGHSLWTLLTLEVFLRRQAW